MLALAVSASVEISGDVHVPFHNGSRWGLLMRPVHSALHRSCSCGSRYDCFAGFVAEYLGGTWVLQCPGVSLLRLLGRGTGSHQSSVGPSLWRVIGGSGCSLHWLVDPMCRGRNEIHPHSIL